MLRTAAVCLLAVSTAVSQGAPQEAAAVITWEPDLETALARTKSDGKPTIAYFTFDT